MSQTILFLLSLLAGICFGLMSYSYQMGRKRNVPATQIAFFVCFTGSIFFMGYLYYNHLVYGLPPGNPWLAPWRVWILTIIAGIGQVASIVMIDPAQKRGPGAPVFCAMNLVFLPASIFAVLVLKEKITPIQILGLAAAIACVLVAGKAQSGAAAGVQVKKSRANSLIYPLFLAGLMISSSLATIVIKQLQAIPFESTSLFTFHKGLFIFLMYACGTLGTGMVLTREGWSNFQTRMAFLLGSLAAAGSICGFLIYCLISALPGGIGFALTNIACFITIAFIAAFIFKEKRNPSWYMAILLAIASVILFSLGLSR